MYFSSAICSAILLTIVLLSVAEKCSVSCKCSPNNESTPFMLISKKKVTNYISLSTKLLTNYFIILK